MTFVGVSDDGFDTVSRVEGGFGVGYSIEWGCATNDSWMTDFPVRHHGDECCTYLYISICAMYQSDSPTRVYAGGVVANSGEVGQVT